MMKPEPSERLSERGAGPGPGPGCPGPGWRGMKRRKNSRTSSSSMPGTCGRAPVRRTACVVLILTTALPWSSTRRVKSGRSRVTSRVTSLCACACAARQKAASHRAAMALIVLMQSLLVFLRPTILDGIGNALHARRGCFSYDGHHVVRDLAGIDMDGAQAREPGARRLAARLQRLDEHRDRGEAVGVHHLTDRLRFAHAPRQFDDLVEAGQLRGQAPAGEARRRR